MTHVARTPTPIDASRWAHYQPRCSDSARTPRNGLEGIGVAEGVADAAGEQAVAGGLTTRCPALRRRGDQAATKMLSRPYSDAVSEPETFEEWKQRTAPSKEQIELARTATLPSYLGWAFIVIFLSTFEYGEKLAILCFLVLWYPTGVLKRRWLANGAALDDRRLVALTWVRLGLGLLLLTALSWGDARNLVLVGVLGVIAVAEMRWHVLEPVGEAIDRLSEACLETLKGLFRRS